MLINLEYFKRGKTFIPNINEYDPNDRLQSELINAMEICEYDTLLSAFGVDMYNDFKQYILVDGGFDENAPQNYLDLVNGKTYEKDEKEKVWRGILETNPRQSFLADLVYYVYKNQTATSSGEFGESLVEGKIGSVASSTPKMVEAWNSFVDKFVGGFRSNPTGLTIEGNPFWVVGSRLGNAFGIDYYGEAHNHSPFVSMIKFLDDNREDYPLLKMKPQHFNLSYKNSFGL